MSVVKFLIVRGELIFLYSVFRYGRLEYRRNKAGERKSRTADRFEPVQEQASEVKRRWSFLSVFSLEDD